MSTDLHANGTCLCGSTRVFVKNVGKSVGVCHCGMCRKWGGGPLMAVDCGTEVTFEGQENISVFDSSDWADRGFCQICGTHLFYRLKGSQQVILPAGLLEKETFIFDHQVFIDEKPSYYSFANKTENMTGEELFAKYAPQSEA